MLFALGFLLLRESKKGEFVTPVHTTGKIYSYEYRTVHKPYLKSSIFLASVTPKRLLLLVSCSWCVQG